MVVVVVVVVEIVVEVVFPLVLGVAPIRAVDDWGAFTGVIAIIAPKFAVDAVAVDGGSCCEVEVEVVDKEEGVGRMLNDCPRTSAAPK